MTTNGDRSSRDRVLAELRAADKLVVVAHENPDGDALGSLVAMQGILSAIGKDCLMFIAHRDLPLPQEYSFFPLDGLVSEPPADIADRQEVTQVSRRDIAPQEQCGGSPAGSQQE